MKKVNIVNLNTVKDKGNWHKVPENVYVGRGSDFGNQFRLVDHNNCREEVVALFKNYLSNNIQLKDRVKKELKGKVLGCFCAPEHCHAEVLHHVAGNSPVYQGSVNMENMSIDEKLSALLLRMDKLDQINETVLSIDTRLSQIEVDTKSLSDQLTQEISKRGILEQSVHETKALAESVETSCAFLSDKYDKLIKEDEERKLALTKNSTDISSLLEENVRLKRSIADLRNDVEQNKATQNKEQQYHRTSLNIKLCGVPTQNGEEESIDGPSNPVTREVIDLVCKTAGITMRKDAIDVCHRLGKLGKGPIIIRFSTKSARCDFTKQGVKLKSITSANLDFSKLRTAMRTTKPQATPSVTRSVARASTEMPPAQHGSDDSQQTASSIYLQEHLTTYNKDLLKEARAVLHDTHQYYGYVKNGEVRVKVSENDKYTIISCFSDIQKELQRVSRAGVSQGS